MHHRSIITHVLATLFILVACGGTIAEESNPQSISQDDLIGTWKLDYTSQQLKVSKDKYKRKSNQTWNFRRDGTVESKASDKRAKADFAVTPKYEVADGKIFIDIPGRPGKKDTFTVIEWSDGKMVLKGSYGYYFFEKE